MIKCNFVEFQCILEFLNGIEKEVNKRMECGQSSFETDITDGNDTKPERKLTIKTDGEADVVTIDFPERKI